LSTPFLEISEKPRNLWLQRLWTDCTD